MPPSCRLAVRVIPRAKKTAVAGRRGDAWVVRLASPPVDGAANVELIRALSDWLSLPRRAVSLVQGDRSRDKIVAIEGLTEAAVLARLMSLEPTE